MFSGKPTKYSPSGMKPKDPMTSKGIAEVREKADPESRMETDDTNATKLTIRPDGSVTVQHADGETTDHPSIGHMAMALHGKHGDGDAAMMQVGSDGKVTTHHVGMDGVVEGPVEHESTKEASEFMGNVMDGELPENDIKEDSEMEESVPYKHSSRDLY